MKGKPLIERLVPGLYFEYQQKNAYLVDVNPYVGYKISGRFTSGVGWNHRLSYDKKLHSWSDRSRIFGPRAYVDFKLGKGFIAHIEGETMNTFVPSTLVGNPDNGKREWVWSTYIIIEEFDLVNLVKEARDQNLKPGSAELNVFCKLQYTVDIFFFFHQKPCWPNLR